MTALVAPRPYGSTITRLPCSRVILKRRARVRPTNEQLELFSSPTHAVSEAMDKINNRWGEFVITPALMMGMDEVILDRISFGGVKELRGMYME